MKETRKVQKFFKKHFTSNPLSYLGWLGILGILGIFFYTWIFVPFLICFTFFTYRNMIADELFWENVRHSTTRAFWSGFLINLVGAILLFVRGFMTGTDPEYQYQELVVQGDTITWGAFSFSQFATGFWVFMFGMILMLLVFSISMLQFRHREKKAMQSHEELE